MNEKRFLYLILTLIFLLMTIMNSLVMISQIQREMHDFLGDTEKLLYGFYQSYVEGNIQDESFPQEIHGVGVYNYYGTSMFTHGSAPDRVDTGKHQQPYFNRKKNTVIVTRDLLDPFSPGIKNIDSIDTVHTRMLEDARASSEEEKKQMIRLIFMEVTDSPLSFVRRRYRIFMGSVTALLLMIIVYIGVLYLRNLKYRNQIESQQRLVMLGTVARTLTHEVKNPLSSIRLQTSIIRRSGCDLHEPSLMIIEEEVERLAGMTERIGDFLRHPEGNPCRTELSEEIRRSLDKGHPGIFLSQGGENAGFPVLIDPERFRSIFDNLVNNAVESGSPAGDITITLERKGHDVILCVADRGCGISEENLKRIQDPFFTTKSRGSGVGLSIVQNFVYAVGGKMEIHSAEDAGTTVRVLFPLNREA